MRGIFNRDWIDLSLIFAAVVGGLGGIIVATFGQLPPWAYKASALFLAIAVLFQFIRHVVIRSK